MRGDEFYAHVAARPPFSRLDPGVAAFFKEYLAHEKVVAFDGRHVVNTHFPPYPSRAFDNLAAHFDRIGSTAERALFSVTLAVTNRCDYNCRHCYNSGRRQVDLPLAELHRVAAALQELGAVHVTLSGGEPLLRDELEQIVAAFDDRTYLSLNTTGSGLTPPRAGALRDAGLFALGVSLDSADRHAHDRQRGVAGAFATAIEAVGVAGAAGLYPYVIAVASHELLERRAFYEFLRLTSAVGAKEVHLLEPCAVGRLAGQRGALLTPAERRRILEFQTEVAADESLPILSSFLYLESADAFGCGAGITHLYIDGSGEVCPCNLVPISFGNVTQEPIESILRRMAEHFPQPRTHCVGQRLAPFVTGERLPLDRAAAAALCREHLPVPRRLPRFFRVRRRAEVGAAELQAAYDRIHAFYDDFWLSEAGRPVRDLIAAIPVGGDERIFEAGCGTGFATALLSRLLGRGGMLTAVDLSAGMLEEARRRLGPAAPGNIELLAGDALALLERGGPFDLVFSSWVLGYIPLAPFFAAATAAIRPGGRLAFVVHRENSPREPLEIFAALVARDPSVLQKKVAFDFPAGAAHVAALLDAAGFAVERAWEGAVVFEYGSAEAVLEHLLKSGAGTAFHDAVDPMRRASLEREFLAQLRSRHGRHEPYRVAHDYVSCVAVRR